MQKWEEQWVRAPRRPRRSRVLTERGGIEEHRDPSIQVVHLPRVEHLARGRHVRQARRCDVPERGEIVNVTTPLAYFTEVTVYRHGRSVRIGPVLVDGHAVAVPDYPSSQK